MGYWKYVTWKEDGEMAYMVLKVMFITFSVSYTLAQKARNVLKEMNSYLWYRWMVFLVTVSSIISKAAGSSPLLPDVRARKGRYDGASPDYAEDS